jgi:hypothetical protein
LRHRWLLSLRLWAWLVLSPFSASRWSRTCALVSCLELAPGRDVSSRIRDFSGKFALLGDRGISADMAGVTKRRMLQILRVSGRCAQTRPR